MKVEISPTSIVWRSLRIAFINDFLLSMSTFDHCDRRECAISCGRLWVTLYSLCLGRNAPCGEKVPTHEEILSDSQRPLVVDACSRMVIRVHSRPPHRRRSSFLRLVWDLHHVRRPYRQDAYMSTLFPRSVLWSRSTYKASGASFLTLSHPLIFCQDSMDRTTLSLVER